MTSELSFELLATHELDRGRLAERSTVEFRNLNNIAIEVQRPDHNSEGEDTGYVLLVRMWDTRTGELIQDFPAETFLTYGEENLGIDASVSGDGSKLAIARWSDGEDWSVRVLDTRTGELLVSESLGDSEDSQGATYVTFSGDGRFLAYANTESDRQAGGVIDIETGAKILDLDQSALEHQGMFIGGNYCGGALSANGGRIAMEGGGAAWVWSGNPSSGSRYGRGKRLPQRTFGISDAAFSSDESLVLTCGGDGSARIWHVETGAELLKLDHGRHVLRGRFSRDGSRILTASAGGTVRLWDARTGDLVALLTNCGGIESQFAFSPDGLRCVTGGSDGIVRIWNSDTGKPLGEPISHPSPVSRIAFTQDGKRLVSASAWEVLLNDAESGVTRARIDGGLLEISVEHDLIVVSDGTFMQLCETRDGCVVWTLNRGMPHAAISPDGARLLYWHPDDDDIYDFDVVSGAPIGLFGRPGQGSGLSQLSFNRDGSRVLGLHITRWIDIPEYEVRLYDAADGSVIANFENANAIAFSPDGLWFWNGDEFYDAASGARVGTAQSEVGAGVYSLTVLTGIEFSPDGTRLILLGASDDPEARIHDPKTGNRVSRLVGHTAPRVVPVEFDPSRDHLLTIDRNSNASSYSDWLGREPRVCGRELRVWEVCGGQRLSRELSVLHARQHDAVDGGCFSTDSVWVLTWSNGQTRVYDPATGTSVAVLTGGQAAFSPDGTRVLTSASGQIHVWDTGNWTQLAVVPGGDPKFTSDGARVLTKSGGQTHVWDAATWAQVAILPGDYPTFSPDGARLFMSSGDQTQLWDTGTWMPLAVLPGKYPRFSPDGTLLLTSANEQIHVWDTGTCGALAVLPGNCPTFSPDGTRLLLSELGETRVWDTGAWAQLAVLKGDLKGDWPRFSIDGTRVLTRADERAYTWDAATWAQLPVLPGEAARFSPDSARALTIGGGGIHVWDVETGSELAVLNGSYPRFSPDGALLLTIGSGETHVWDTATWTQRAVLVGDNARLSPAYDGPLVLTNKGDQVYVWDTATWKQRGSFPWSVQSTDRDPGRACNDGRYILSTPSWQSACILDLEKGGALIPLVGSNDRHTEITQAKYSPDGTLILTTGDDGRIRLWDPVSGSFLVALDAGTTTILAGAEFSPDGKTVLAACGDYSLRLWDVASGRQLAVMDGHDAKIDAFSFSADGQQIVTVSGSTLRRWGLSEPAAPDNSGVTA